jgi:hypothetical protein
MSGPKRNPDKLNTIGVVVVGICGAVLVYVTIVALQAFYMNDTSEIQTMADYGGQDTTAKTHRASEMGNITEYGKNAAAPNAPQTYRMPIDQAMKDVIESAKSDPSHLVPALPPAQKPTIEPVFGRPKPIAPPAPPPAAAPAEGSGSAAAAPTGTTAAPTAPTGTPGEPHPVSGTGGQSTTPKATPKTPKGTPPAKAPKAEGSGSAAPKGSAAGEHGH